MINWLNYKNTFNTDNNFITELSGIYMYSILEDRSKHFTSTCYSNIQFIKLEAYPKENMLTIDNSEKMPIESDKTYNQLLKKFNDIKVYVDITGMMHSIWIPLLKKMCEKNINFSVIYVEPYQYLKNTETDITYDLNEEEMIIKPLHGFKNISIRDDDFLLIPILGFEGARFIHLINELDAYEKEIFPIIGNPSFNPEYIFDTYHTNAQFLQGTKSWRNVKYASASCPFSIFAILEKIYTDYPDKYIKIGLMGTKPHALGSVLFQLIYPKRTEIIYDHQIKKPKGSEKHGIKHIYEISNFFNDMKNKTPLP